MTLHAVSLFSGIGLLDLAMHRAGIPTRLLCEADKAARSVLARRFPDVPIHPDVQELTADDLRSAGADPARTVLHIYMKEMATDDIATSVHGLMSRSHAETGG